MVASRPGGSIPPVGGNNNICATESETEVRMKRVTFRANLTLKWVVGLIVPLTLGMCGVCSTRPNATSTVQLMAHEC